MQIDFRWTHGDADRVRKYAAELVAQSPDVILVAGGSHVGPLQQVSRSVPIVFVQVTDPVGGGFVSSLARPGGNTTGFTVFEFDISAKWLELLKQIAPNLKRAAVLRLPDNPAAMAQFGAIQAAGQSLGVEISAVSVSSGGEIDRAMANLVNAGNGGLIVTPSAGVSMHRDLIIKLAARHKLPAVYGTRRCGRRGVRWVLWSAACSDRASLTAHRSPQTAAEADHPLAQ